MPVSGDTLQVPPYGSWLTNTIIDETPVAIPLIGVVAVSVNSNFHRKMFGLSKKTLLWASNSVVFVPDYRQIIIEVKKRNELTWIVSSTNLELPSCLGNSTIWFDCSSPTTTTIDTCCIDIECSWGNRIRYSSFLLGTTPCWDLSSHSLRTDYMLPQIYNLEN